MVELLASAFNVSTAVKAPYRFLRCYTAMAAHTLTRGSLSFAGRHARRAQAPSRQGQEDGPDKPGRRLRPRRRGRLRVLRDVTLDRRRRQVGADACAQARARERGRTRTRARGATRGGPNLLHGDAGGDRHNRAILRRG